MHEQNGRSASARGGVDARGYSYGGGAQVWGRRRERRGESLPWIVHSPPDRHGLADFERILSLLAVALDHDELADPRRRGRGKRRIGRLLLL